MANKIYRSALGKPVDMGALLIKNEAVRAVGNMSVNARGDKINKTNETTVSRTNQVNNNYRKQIRNQIIDEPVIPSTQTSNKIIDDADEIEGLDSPWVETEQVEDDVAQTNSTPPEKKKSSGLASAIAKAREIEQKKLQTPREESRSKTGVKKI
jgi:hypothetical protein